MRRAWLTVLLPIALVVLLGCSTAPLPSPSPSSAEPSPAQPTARATAPAPGPTATPTPEPPDGLRVGGMATITVDGLRRVADPDDRSSRPGLNRRYGRLNTGDRVFLVDGPRTIDGVDYWQLWPSYWHESSPLGWARASRANGGPTMEPYQPPCPANDQPSLDELLDLDGLERLACFADRELTLRGRVTCERPIVDDFIGGAPWMSSHRYCWLTDGLALNGEPIFQLLESPEWVDRISGRYEVRGHFDDAGARRCHSIPFGVSLETEGQGQPGPVMECRQRFVVSAVSELE